MAIFSRSRCSTSTTGRRSALPRWLPLAPCAVAVSLLPWRNASAQDGASAAAPAEVITITGKALAAPASVGGFGAVPLARAPFQATTVTANQWQDAGVASLNDVTRLDASISDAYNSPGYWASLNVRGYALDPHFNVQRDGLPVSGETAMLLDNKERLEVLKGTSGVQAGTSSPAGLMNLVVKRPRGTNQRSVLLGLTDTGSLKAAVDWDQTLSDDGRTAVRINASAERLDPPFHDAQGHRHLLAAAAKTEPTPHTRLEAEIELSHQSQPSLPGFSLLGNQLPKASAINPRVNLNNQAWSQPVVFDGSTSSLRWTEDLSSDWKLITQGLLQRLTTNDRIAFPFGCSSEGNYDRYCSDGSMDLYDYRSEGEHRTSRALALSLEGSASTGGLQHQLSTGLTWNDFRARLGQQAYNWAGLGQIDGSVQVPASPDKLYDNTNRTERNLAWHLRDAISLTADTQLWLGLRHTRLHRASAKTSGTPGDDYAQNFTTPWLALSQQLTPDLMLYGSWGQGIETEMAPNLPMYSNAGQALPALRSHQTEIGLKFDDLRQWSWALTAFDIKRPEVGDTGICDGTVAGGCTHVADGQAHHLGLEASTDLRLGLWTLHGSSLWLKARNEDATGSNAGLNGMVPTNVAQRSLRASATAQVPAISGLGITTGVSHEGSRAVLPDHALSIPGWTTWELAARYQTTLASHPALWRLGVDNLFDQRAWQESPYQYSHVYLYPLAPRTFRASLQLGL